MPELPEVEIVARDLHRRIAGRILSSAELRRERLVPDMGPEAFAKRLTGPVIRFVHRRGKHVLLDLDNGLTLIVHLRMSGRFMLLSTNDADPKFAHAVFHFEDGERLIFDDQRHFGMMKLVETPALAQTKQIAKLAPEPFSEEFSPAFLSNTVRSSTRTLKAVLLDQTKVCGVGNIYASEALFLSGIDPRRRGDRVGTARLQVLHGHIRAVLSEAIELAAGKKAHPTIIGEGVYGEGSEDRWRVYDREGEPCLNCATPIKRIVQAGRSTYYCPKCQR